MKKEKDKIAQLFRDRLVNAEMPVRDGFWETLQEDVKRKPALLPMYRVAAAASVLLVLGAASAAFWYFSPKEKIQDAFTQAAALTPEVLTNGDQAEECFLSHAVTSSSPVVSPDVSPVVRQVVRQQPTGDSSALVDVGGEARDGELSVRVSITITQRVYGMSPSDDGYFNTGAVQAGSGYPSASETGNNVEEVRGNSAVNHLNDESSVLSSTDSRRSMRKWALKAAVGTSLPKEGWGMPLTAAFTVERCLNRVFSLETGLQYNRLPSEGTLHTLGIPLKMNAVVARMPKADFYVTAGGAAEKCVAGTSDNGWTAEPVQLSVAAGVGVRYRLNERFALFAEPSVSHHFATNSDTRTVRTERPVNLNLLCGVRMAY